MVKSLIQQQPLRNQPNSHNIPNLQLFISASKVGHISELLEATNKMIRYFRKSYKSSKSQHTNIDNNYPHITHNNSLHSDKHTDKTHNPNDQLNEITGQTKTPASTETEPENTEDPHDSDSPDSNFDSSDS